jgi:hypothetical protein
MNNLKEKLNKLDSNPIIKHAKINKTLHPDIWKDGKLDPEVCEKLVGIVGFFLAEMNIEEFENFKLEDVIFTGSLANYTYTDYSDLDLHLIYSFSGDSEAEDIFIDLMLAKKTIWNLKNDINIKNFEVEIYTQTMDEDHFSSGVYSILDNKWIIRPVKREESNIDINKLYQKVEILSNMIDKAVENNNELELEKVFDKIKKLRKQSLEEEGAFSSGNMVFKVLRSMKKIKKIVLAISRIKVEKHSLVEKTASQKKKGLKEQKHLQNKLNNLEKKRGAEEEKELSKNRSGISQQLKKDKEDQWLDNLNFKAEHEDLEPFKKAEDPSNAISKLDWDKEESNLSLLDKEDFYEEDKEELEQELDPDLEDSEESNQESNQESSKYASEIFRIIDAIVDTIDKIGNEISPDSMNVGDNYFYKKNDGEISKVQITKLQKDSEKALIKIIESVNIKVVNEDFAVLKPDLYKTQADAEKQEALFDADNLEDLLNKIKQSFGPLKNWYKSFDMILQNQPVKKAVKENLKIKFNNLNETVTDMIAKIPIFSTTVSIIVDFLSDLYKLFRTLINVAPISLLKRLVLLLEELINSIKKFNAYAAKSNKNVEEILETSKEYAQKLIGLKENLVNLIQEHEEKLQELKQRHKNRREYTDAAYLKNNKSDN